MRIKMRRLLGVLAACGLALPLWSQATAAAAQACKDPGSTMLWQVQAPAGTGQREVTVAVLGSVHVGKPEFYPLPAVIDRAFKAANTLVFEVDISAMQSPQATQTLLARAMLPGDQTIDKLVDASTLKLMQETLPKMGIPLQAVSKLKPWMVSMMLTELQVQTLGYDAQAGVENYLLQHKPPAAKIGELESLDAQLSMLESLNQSFFLKYSLQDSEATGAQMEALTTAWRCGDHKDMEAIMFDARDKMKASPADAAALDALMKKLLLDRNVGMADRIDDYFKAGRGNYFIAVGALHLLGEGSVLDLLRKRGYTIIPVRK